MTALSRTQVDRLGERLKRGFRTEEDLRALDAYRRSFGSAYTAVVAVLRSLGLEPTGRPAKSTDSLVEKLRRESIRLVQIQDIAGCRVVVADVVEQNSLVTRLRAVFPDASIVDRRANPSFGYRAVHVVTAIEGKLVEIQIRTKWQHLWAELSEKVSDQVDKNLKYGGGPENVSALMAHLSDSIDAFERVLHEHELVISNLRRETALPTTTLHELQRLDTLSSETMEAINRAKSELDRMLVELAVAIGRAISEPGA